MSGAKLFPSVAEQMTFQHQPDAYLNQANPVSNVLYTVLPLTRNARIISINAAITWAVTQPTPLEVVVTVDGNVIRHSQANPVSGANYPARAVSSTSENFQDFNPTLLYDNMPIYEGRSVTVAARIIWAVTQPTPLVCRVKWARR